MKTGILSISGSAAPSPKTLMEYLNSSSFDELLEIDLSRDRSRNIYHVEGKYFVPLLEGTFSDLFQYSAEHMVHPDDAAVFQELMDPATIRQRLAAADPPGLLTAQFRYKLLDGGWRWVEQTVVMGEEYGLPRNILRCFIFDIQYQRNRQMGLVSSYPSGGNRDELTGLLREKAFFTMATEMLANHSVTWSLIALDIENFKLFNDWYGRDKGDLLLAKIGGVLKREENHVGGLAGYRGQDDFCLLIPYDMERIQRLYEEIHQLVKLRGSSMGFLPAVGISVVEPEATVMDAVDQASLAAGHIKGNFHSRILTYSPSMRSKTEGEYRVLSDFQRALSNRELYFCLQPQCQVPTGRIVGAESLARWRTPDGKMVPPDAFIPILEKYGFVTDLDQYLWEDVCIWLHKWISSGHTPVPISINVSQIDIFTIDVPEFLKHLTEKYELPKNVLKIEITESAYVDDTATVKDTVRRLREEGFLVLMDDFGSGYSSLNMLRKLNVDIIKLDAQFLRLSEEDDRKGIHILETIVNMTKTMAIPIIVEGVESEEQVNFLQNLGCRYIQGYHYYRPMPVREFEALIENEQNIDTGGFRFKPNQQFSVREFMDQNIYSDSMLNNILGAAAFYSWDQKENVDIVRFNEQFYRLVNVPDFHERVRGIQRFFHPKDVRSLFDTLRAAEKDRLNGASGVFGVYRTDGSIGRFHLQLFFLEERENDLVFYGAMQEVTGFTDLQNKMRLLSAYSSSSTVFLRKPEGKPTFQVVIHGLKDSMGLSAGDFQRELNDGSFRVRLDRRGREMLQKLIAQPVDQARSYSSPLLLTTPDRRHEDYYMKADFVRDEYSDVEYIIHIRQLRD